MSYEGYEEYLCEQGHHLVYDCYEMEPVICFHCGSKLTYWHPVDQTNGIENDNPSTFNAKTEVIGYDEEWQEDHLGNKYVTKLWKFKPISEEWRKII